MIYILMLFLLAVCYHTISYSIYLIKKEKNKLAAFGTIVIALLGLAAPVLMLIYRY